ncbi:MAG TPA: rhomboid family intramembrane serine protease [Pyrinomonadaceae bacterium]|nr:rhomboid family intramembrane serine protease [Pyrinomonadaceae bacterium]
MPPIELQSQHPWEITGSVSDKPKVSDYGYLIKDQSIGCSKEDLIKEASRGPLLRLVWTPETPEPVRPETVSFLTPAFKKRAVREAWKLLAGGAALLLFGIVLSFSLDDWKYLYRNLWAVIGGVLLVEGAWGLRRARAFTIEDAQSDASSARFASWAENKGIGGYTVLLAAAIVLVGVAQLLAGDSESIQAAGLVKAAVWQGQIWRLATATLMHVNFMHFWMNMLALLALARIIEQTLHRSWVPLVFLVSAIGGSLFSLVLYPHTTSVGASGGILGLLGFLTVAVMRNREKYPPKYLRRLLEGIAFIGVFGAIGFAMIDNGGHLGGLVAGAACGWFFLSDKFIEKTKSVLPQLGGLSLALIAVAAGFAIWQILN